MAQRFGQRLPPMPNKATVVATVRDTGREQVPVARTTLTDPTGESRTFDLDEHGALELASQLIAFVRQVRP